MATKHNFVANRGETFSLKINSVTDSTGAPVDLTGHTIVLSLKDSAGTVLHEYSNLVTSMPFTLKVSVEEVDAWTIGNNKYVLKDEQPNTDVSIFAYGSITVKELD